MDCRDERERVVGLQQTSLIKTIFSIKWYRKRTLFVFESRQSEILVLYMKIPSISPVVTHTGFDQHREVEYTRGWVLFFYYKFGYNYWRFATKNIWTLCPPQFFCFVSAYVCVVIKVCFWYLSPLFKISVYYIFSFPDQKVTLFGCVPQCGHHLMIEKCGIRFLWVMVLKTL